MIVLKNQTLYQCEYCGKRLLSRNGAKIHEEQYCGQSPIVKQKRIDEIKKCNHEYTEHWDYIPGEAVKEPHYSYCLECGATEREIKKLEGDD